MNFPQPTSPFQKPGESGQWGWFALVSYVPDPQKSMLDSLRTAIPGRALPPVHITVLPPRPLPFSIEHACNRVEGIIGGTAAFEAELSDVRFFSQTEFLYLDITEGSRRICEIHEKLNAGDLSHPEFHEFRPHLTLGGPIPQNRLQAARDSVANEWHHSECPRRVLVDQLVCLWLNPAREGREWIKYRSFPLISPSQKSIAFAAEARNQRFSTAAPNPDAFGPLGS